MCFQVAEAASVVVAFEMRLLTLLVLVVVVVGVLSSTFDGEEEHRSPRSKRFSKIQTLETDVFPTILHVSLRLSGKEKRIQIGLEKSSTNTFAVLRILVNLAVLVFLRNFRL